MLGGVNRNLNMKHFHEHLVRDHVFRWGYTWVKTQPYARQVVGAHRHNKEREGVTRQRRPLRTSRQRRSILAPRQRGISLCGFGRG
jgi:hypothetical protein